MKIIAAAALAGAALLAAALPAHADEGPLDFGIFKGVNESKGSNSTGPNATWGQQDGGANQDVPKSVLTDLVNRLTTPGGH